MSLVRLENLTPGTCFRYPGETSINTLVSVGYTWAKVDMHKNITRTFEVVDKLTGEPKTITVTKPFIKEVAPGAEVEVACTWDKGGDWSTAGGHVKP